MATSTAARAWPWPTSPEELCQADKADWTIGAFAGVTAMVALMSMFGLAKVSEVDGEVSEGAYVAGCEEGEEKDVQFLALFTRRSHFCCNLCWFQAGSLC